LEQILHPVHQLRQIDGLGPESWRRANANRRCVSAAPRSRPGLHCRAGAAPRSSGQPLAEQFEAAQHRHQQVLKSWATPPVELADRVELLRLEKLGKNLLALARPLVDPAFEFLVQRVQLRRRGCKGRGALGDAPLQLGVELLQLGVSLRYSSAKTLTLARKTSGTTGTGT